MVAVNTYEKYQNQSPLRVLELFAGVGGFRLGLERVHGNPFEVVCSNQWEPARKKQYASEIYRAHWQDGLHLNEDIAEVLQSEAGRAAIREARPDVVVGGFPCQDYSVAKPLSQARGIEGKKGKLWWSIAELLWQRLEDGEPVKYIILENVDRLISSPASCPGRDFAMVLSTLCGMGYAAEWRVVNAADYGFPQRRRRTFLVAYHVTTPLAHRVVFSLHKGSDGWLSESVLTRAFPAVHAHGFDLRAPAYGVRHEPLEEQMYYRPLSNGKSRFANSGLMVGTDVWTAQAKPKAFDDFSMFTGSAHALTLGDVVRRTGPVPTAFYVKPEEEPKWLAAKAAKRVPRVKNGFEYEYAEGAMAFPDPLDRPSRTIITSEGGRTPSRAKHAVREASGLVRRLTPEELEELNGFPRGFTDCAGASDATRAMLMGNALVVGLVTRIGEALFRAHSQNC